MATRDGCVDFMFLPPPRSIAESATETVEFSMKKKTMLLDAQEFETGQICCIKIKLYLLNFKSLRN